MTDSLQQQLDDLRAQVARLSGLADVQEITQLVMTYGPLVDSGSAEATAGLWTDDGVYEVDGVLSMTGRDEIAGMVRGTNHQAIIHGGAGHVLTAPRVRVDGDTAEAVNHAMLVTRTGDAYTVSRVSANWWTCRRTADGWRVVRRVNRPLDGRASSRELFAELAGGS